jgi:glycopeptide antibiotics resistance protein
MSRKPFIVVASICLGFIVFATLCPLHDRPHFWGSHEPGWVSALERFTAYIVFGFFVRLASPSRFSWLLIFSAAVSLELLQHVVPHRDPRMIDALIKLAGGAVGIIVARNFIERTTPMRLTLAPLGRRTTKPM